MLQKCQVGLDTLDPIEFVLERANGAKEAKEMNGAKGQG